MSEETVTEPAPEVHEPTQLPQDLVDKVRAPRPEQHPALTEEGQRISQMAKDQIAAVLKATDCVLVPVTTIINGRISQIVDVLYSPKQRIQPVRGAAASSILKP